MFSVTYCGLFSPVHSGEISPNFWVWCSYDLPDLDDLAGSCPIGGASAMNLGCSSVTCGISLFSIAVLFILITVLAPLACLHASACSLSILTGSCNESHCINCSLPLVALDSWFFYGLPCYTLYVCGPPYPSFLPIVIICYVLFSLLFTQLVIWCI